MTSNDREPDEPEGGPLAARTLEELPLVIGVGTEHRGDDRCGLDVARALREPLGRRARVAECAGDITDLLDLWDGVGEVIVVDAVRSGRAPGTVVRWEVPGSEPPRPGVTSTHGLSLAEAIGLGRSLGRLPGRLVVYGIEADNVAMGDGLSPSVAQAVRAVIAQVAEELVTRDRRRREV